MRFVLSLAALAALAACATTPSSAPATPSAPVAAAPSRVLEYLSAAGRSDAPTQAQIERELGQADIARQDGAGAALTYRLETCALLLLFEADQRNAMRLAEAHAGPRQAGQAAPSLAQCAAEAGARRS